MGGVIFFTACMAAISGTFALSMIISNIWVAMAFGLFWGLMIFNLDRYIVSTLRKKEKQNKFTPVLQAIPRLLLAVLFAVVISKPLELRLFANEIESKRPEAASQKTLHLQSQIDSLHASNKSLELIIDSLERNPQETYFQKQAEQSLQQNLKNLDSISQVQQIKIEALEQEVKGQNRIYNKYIGRVRELKRTIPTITNDSLKQVLQREYNSKRARVAKASDRAKRLRQQIEQLKEPIDRQEEIVNTSRESVAGMQGERKTEIGKRIREKREELQGNLATITQLQQRRQRDIDGYQGLLAQLNAHALLKEEDSTIYWTSMAVFLLFIAVEIAPIFFKLLTPIGPYDILLEKDEKRSLEVPEQAYAFSFEPEMTEATYSAEDAVDSYQRNKPLKYLKIRQELEDKALNQYLKLQSQKLDNGELEEVEEFLQGLQHDFLPFLNGKEGHLNGNGHLNGQSGTKVKAFVNGHSNSSALENSRWQFFDKQSQTLITYSFSREGKFTYQAKGQPKHGKWRYVSPENQSRIEIALDGHGQKKLLNVEILEDTLSLQEVYSPDTKIVLDRL